MSVFIGTPRYRRSDHEAIVHLINPNERILDVGCGDGQLLEILRSEKNARCQGLEMSQAGVNLCVARGLSVVQGDANTDLAVYQDKAFDCAILSKTIQQLGSPHIVLSEMSRIARRIIITFRNYGYWRTRLSLLIEGRMPTPGRISNWYAEEARRPCTILDMAQLAQDLDLNIINARKLPDDGTEMSSLRALNLLASEAILVLQRK